MSVLSTLTLNGLALEDYGLTVTDLQGWLTIPKRTFPTLVLPGYQGQRRFSQGSRTEARTLPLAWLSQPASLKAGRDLLNSTILLLSGLLEIATVDDPSKVCYGVLVSADVTTFGVAMLAPGHDVAAQLICDDPLWYDATPQAVTVSAPDTPVVLPMGSAPVRRSIIRINGPLAAGVTLIAKDATGAEFQRMTLTPPSGVSVGANDYVDVDSDAYTITYVASGVASDARNWLGTNETFFRFDPLDTPALQYHVASGTAAGVVYLYRAFVS